MTGLYRRAKVWWFRWSFQGAQRRESLGTEDEAAAILLARRILEAPERLAAGQWEHEVKRYFAAMVEGGEMRTSTVVARKPVLCRFFRELGVAVPDQVSERMVEDWLRKVRNAHSSNAYLAWIRTFYRWLRDEGRCRGNPAARVAMRQARLAPKMRVLSAAQIRALLETCTDPEVKMMLFLGLDCGLRKAEIIEARAEWINLEAGTLQVMGSESWIPKDKEQRVIPLTRRFMEFLRGLKKIPEPFLIAPKVKKGRSIYRFDPDVPLKRYLATQKLPWVTFKVLRQSFGSVRVSGGAEIAKVSRWMGHSKIQTTMDHYLAFAPGDDAIERGI